MADNPTVYNGPTLGTFIVSADEALSGQVQRMKLAFSADGSDTLIGADTNGLDVDITRLPSSTTGAQSAVTVGTTATLLVSALTSRKAAIFRPAGTIYIGYSNTVTTSTGTPLYANEVWEETIFKGAVYAVTVSGTVNTRVLDAQ